MEGSDEIAISLGKARQDYRGVLESNLAIKESCVFQKKACLNTFPVLCHWQGEACVKWGIGTNTAVDFRAQGPGPLVD